MSVNGKFVDITRYDLLKVAERFGIGTATRIIENVRDAIKLWPSFAAEAGLKPHDIQRILEHHSLL
jgi:serine/threonine-protein kinase HipA